MSHPVLVIGNKNYSSWSLRPWLALKHAGIAFQEVRISLDTPQTVAQIRAYSPSGRVPVFIDGTLKIWESLAICEYAAEIAPAAGLWPEGREQRAVARAIAGEMHAGFAALRAELPMDVRSRHDYWSVSAAAEADIQRIFTIWRSCRAEYARSGPFLFGHFTIADAMFAPVVTRFVTYNVTLGAIESAYCQALLALPHFQEWIAAARSEQEVLPVFRP